MAFARAQCFMVEKCNVRDEDDATLFDIRRLDTGTLIAVGIDWTGFSKLPPGAMWWADWSANSFPKGPDDWSDMSAQSVESNRRAVREHPEWYAGKLSDVDPTLPKRSPSHIFSSGPQLVVICPGGALWNIDSRASNCTMPYDYEHRCWVRHGEPPNITVDKQGKTCAAGAGSIQADKYHGFLRDGWFTEG